MLILSTWGSLFRDLLNSKNSNLSDWISALGTLGKILTDLMNSCICSNIYAFLTHFHSCTNETQAPFSILKFSLSYCRYFILLSTHFKLLICKDFMEQLPLQTILEAANSGQCFLLLPAHQWNLSISLPACGLCVWEWQQKLEFTTSVE